MVVGLKWRDEKMLKGLDEKFRHDVCGSGNAKIKRCRFLRYVKYKGEVYLICGKNTAAGIKHSRIINEISKEAPDGIAIGDKVAEIVTGDNCPGRAGEFTHLFEDKIN